MLQLRLAIGEVEIGIFRVRFLHQLYCLGMIAGNQGSQFRVLDFAYARLRAGDRHCLLRGQQQVLVGAQNLTELRRYFRGQHSPLEIGDKLGNCG